MHSCTWQLVGLVSDERSQQFFECVEDDVVAIVSGRLRVERTADELDVACYRRVPGQTAIHCAHLKLTQKLINAIVLDAFNGGRE